jgi:hypothetical protein
MKKHRLLLVLASVSIAACSFVGGAIASIALLRELPVDVGDETRWRLLRSVRMVADTTEGEVAAKVDVLEHLSQGVWSSETVLQNKIEIIHEARTVSFMWRDPTFAGTWCEIRDLDADGAAEFVLVEAESVARVVFYAGGRFTFRPIDQVQTIGKLRLVDLPDHRIGFAVSTATNQTTIRQWSRDRGFF